MLVFTSNKTKMKKTIFKEILLTLLVIVAIILVLAVVFYQYIPTNRAIPSKVTAYQASEEVSKEISEDANSELVEQHQTYEITDEDLSMYKKIDSYRPGKVDPFATTSDKADEGETGNNVNPSNPQPNDGQQEKDKNTTDNYYSAAGVGSGTK